MSHSSLLDELIIYQLSTPGEILANMSQFPLR